MYKNHNFSDHLGPYYTKNGEKLFSLKSTFVGKNSQKSILYKRKKVTFFLFSSILYKLHFFHNVS